MNRVVIVHQEVSDSSDESDLDVLVQRDAVASVLREMGVSQIETLPCNLDLQSLKQQLNRIQPDLVFNLVESLDGTDRLLPMVPLFLEANGIPFTGCSSHAIQVTSDKVLSKHILLQAGLPTPAWQKQGTSLGEFDLNCPVIIKAISEHASFDLDDTSVARYQSSTEVESALEQRKQKTGREYFAEQFVSGREFNLSILAGEFGPVVLPAAEIDFSRFPTDQPQIVGYRAKWDSESPEYVLTPRRFSNDPRDQKLYSELSELAKSCWELFSLSGFARVDFRVDEQNRPWILEINANPCLSPDAGFAAALEQAGISYQQAIEQICQAALKGH